MLERVDIILHRPQASENVGAAARAMKNFGLPRLVLVSPRRFDLDRAKTLAVHAGEILDHARLALTLDEALAPYAMVIPTTARAVPGRPAPLSPTEAATALVDTARTSRVALLFGAEASGLPNYLLARFPTYTSIPADPQRKSLNLAQAVLLYAWELHQQSGLAPELARPDPARRTDQPAPFVLVTELRQRARRLLLANGFLNAQQPDRALDELMRVLLRAQPTQRELELLLAALAQVERTSTVAPR